MRTLKSGSELSNGQFAKARIYNSSKTFNTDKTASTRVSYSKEDVPLAIEIRHSDQQLSK